MRLSLGLTKKERCLVYKSYVLKKLLKAKQVNKFMKNTIIYVIILFALVFTGCSSNVANNNEDLEVRQDAIVSTLRTADTTLDVNYYPRNESDKAIILYQENNENASVWQKHIPAFQRTANVITFTPNQPTNIDNTINAFTNFLDRRRITTNNVYVVVVGQSYQNSELAGIFLIGVNEAVLVDTNQFVFQQSDNTFSQNVENEIITFIN